MNDKLAVTVDAEPIDVVINIKVSGDLPDDGTDGQVLMRVGGKNVWADPPTSPGGGIAKEIDPTVPAWAKQPNKPKYTAEEVGAASKEDVEQLSKEVADKQPKGDYALKSEIPEAPEPYILPVASADTLGGVKVGAGLRMDGDELTVMSERKYEKLASVTVGAGGAKEITFPNVSDLLAVMACIVMPEFEGIIGIFLSVVVAGAEYVVGGNYGSAHGKYSIRLEISINGGILSGTAQGNVAGWGSGDLQGVNSAGQAVFAEKIISAYIYCPNADKSILEGTTIELYGVKV